MFTKSCNKCLKKFYAIEQGNFVKHFPRNKKYVDGFSTCCKNCTNEYKRKMAKKYAHKRSKKPLLNKNCVVCLKPFQTKREKTETCGKECSIIRKRVYVRLSKRDAGFISEVKRKRALEIEKCSEKVRKHYTADEIDFIKKNMHSLPVTKIAKKINRTYYGTYFKVKELKLIS